MTEELENLDEEELKKIVEQMSVIFEQLVQPLMIAFEPIAKAFDPVATSFGEMFQKMREAVGEELWQTIVTKEKYILELEQQNADLKVFNTDLRNALKETIEKQLQMTETINEREKVIIELTKELNILERKAIGSSGQ